MITGSSELTDLLQFLTGPIFVLCFIGFLVASYGILWLLGGSWKKPLLYIAYPFVAVGTILVLGRFLVPQIVNILSSSINIPMVVLDVVLRPILVSGIVCLLVGVAMRIGYGVLTKSGSKKLGNRKNFN